MIKSEKGPGLTCRILLVLGAMAAFLGQARAVDPTWNYAVQVSAVVSANPPTITLSWVDDTTQGRDGYQPAYTVSRKAVGATAWGEAKAVDRGQTSFTDTDVTPGVAYEYQVARDFRDPAAPEANHVAYGYVMSGIDVPYPERRGKVVLAVEQGIADALADRVARLRGDLVGDGWAVVQVTVAADERPERVRDAIRAQYDAGAAANVVFLLGHLPVVKAGRYAPDGHEQRPMPCDAYYGDVDGDWVDANGDGIFDRNVIASDIEMQVGRVDFSGLGETVALSEVDLTARYLDKDHEYRNGRLQFGARGLIGDRVGIDRGRAPAAAAYRAFTAFYGPDAIVTANTEDGGEGQRWYPALRERSFAWAFGSGGGSYELVAFLGEEGQYYSVTSANLAADAKAAFYLLFGSYFVEWDHANNLVRSALAAPEGGLGGAWSGRPSFILHPMGLGETVGYGVRLTQNNEGLYFSPTNAFRRAVHIAWMGDPTLRLFYPAPVTDLAGERQGGSVRLSWRAPDRAGARFDVYRASSSDGPFVRITPSPIAETHFIDTAGGAPAYMVRSVVTQQTASGTFENPGTGAIWTDGMTVSNAQAQPLETPPERPLLPLLFTPPPDNEQPGPRAPRP